MIRPNEFFVDNLWRWKCGLQEVENRDRFKRGSVKDIEQIRDSHFPKEWNELLELADNRIFQGAFRYGPISGYLKIEESLSDEIQKRISFYEDTGNLEHIIDAFNFIRIEYYKATNQGRRLKPIDDGPHYNKI